MRGGSGSMDNDEKNSAGGLDTRLAGHIIRLVEERGAGKTICPSEAARAERGDDWRSLMKPVRRVAQNLAREGRIAIYRKGKPVDPDNFKGVIRLGLP